MRHAGRRTSRVQEVRRSARLFAQVLALAVAHGRPLFIVDRYIEDPLHPGFVWRFPDCTDPAHFLEQSSPAKQVPVPIGHADFGGRLCASFTGVQEYISNRTGAQWAYDGDGVSLEKILIFTPTATSGGNVGAATISQANVVGTQLYVDATNCRSILYSASGLATPNSSLGAIALNTPTYLDVRYLATDGSAQYQHRRNGTLVSSGNYAVALGSAATQRPMCIGSNGNAQFYLSMRWRALLMFRALSNAERALLQSWIQSDSGIAA